MTELAIRTAIVRALRQAGAYVLVTTGVSQVGTPDLLVCWQGRFIALEVKQPKNYATKMQHSQIARIEAAGGLALVVRSVAEALATITNTQL